MKVIVAGGRTFSDYNLLCKHLDHLLSNYNKENIEIVSGTAQGADKLGERYAIEKNIPMIRFPADWNTHGRSAGYIRNSQMADYADACVVFWDGESKGSKHMIDLATKKKLQCRVVNY